MTMNTINAQSVSPPYSATNFGIHAAPDRVKKAAKMTIGTSSRYVKRSFHIFFTNVGRVSNLSIFVQKPLFFQCRNEHSEFGIFPANFFRGGFGLSGTELRTDGCFAQIGKLLGRLHIGFR